MKNTIATENHARFKDWTVLLCTVFIMGGCGGRGVNLRSPSEAPPDAVPVLGRLNPKSDLAELNKFSQAEVLVGSETDSEFKAYFQIKPADDGWFRWRLRPGRYVIQTIRWEGMTEGSWTARPKHVSRNRRIWATFTVPEGAHVVYIGTFAFDPSSKDRFIHEAQVVDEFHILPPALAKEVEGVDPTQQLMEWSEPR
ncbi:MAG: hypothetical protein OEV49_11770 [candidate division Zixibacteria bacterium]|nr:hypothetical protein [candidate division Zixibacteria bacterium]MDH3936007.1 hypothetical protein [candidate division Zixibacteria bacterium]MDH4033971.1 hypothetical protein [candidate division Zixibacteria bacterium]